LGQESFLASELSHLSPAPQCTQLAPGVVELTGVDIPFLALNPLLFSRQLLPDAFPLDGNSIKTFASAIVTTLIERLPEELPGWNLFIFEPATADSGEEYSRARLIQQETLAILKQKRRSLVKTLLSEHQPDAAVVQVLLSTKETAFMSVTPAQAVAQLQSRLTPRLGGYVDIPDDKRPPSRAFKKLEEALLVFGLNPRKGDTCVDLGACPGGWTHVMVERGAKVTAIDRSPLDDRLMKHKSVSFIKGDAFTWTPTQPVTWLICDVITTPDRTLRILDTWLSKKLCSLFCVTVKFKGEPDFESLREIRQLLRERTSWFDGKQLAHNKNELTVVGKV
jgi:23S rRNA (cytidine2498-2'-O)-methyltransferase